MKFYLKPHPKKPVTNAQVVAFYKQLADSISIVDPNTPFLIGANNHYDITLMDSIYTSTIPNVFYTFNYYLPTDYVKPDKRTQSGLPIVGYPSNYKDFNGDSIHLNKSYLQQILQAGTSFRDKYQVPIYINQVGAPTAAPNYLLFTNDVLDVFNSQHVGFAWWTWRTNDDSTKYGLYYKNTTGQYVLKQNLYNVINTKLGSYNYCSETLTEVHSPNNSESKLVYPNPTTGSVYLPSFYSGTGTIRVTSAEGRVVLYIENVELSSITSIDLGKESKGIYIIQVIGGGTVNTSKVVLN